LKIRGGNKDLNPLPLLKGKLGRHKSSKPLPLIRGRLGGGIK